MYADGGFRELDWSKCLQLPARAVVGRVVYERRALPAVVPVDIALDGEAVTGQAPHERPLCTAPHFWEPWPEEVFVRIKPALVTGRELVAGGTASSPVVRA